MDDTQQVQNPDAPVEEPAKPTRGMRKPSLRTNVRMAALAGIGLLMLILVVAASNVRLASGIRAERAKTVNALAYALREPVLQQDPPKLRTLLEGMATAAGYERLTVTDPSGKVIASTDRRFDDTTIKELATTTQEPKFEQSGAQQIARTTVWLAKGNAIGGVEIVFKAD